MWMRLVEMRIELAHVCGSPHTTYIPPTTVKEGVMKQTADLHNLADGRERCRIIK